MENNGGFDQYPCLQFWINPSKKPEWNKKKTLGLSCLTGTSLETLLLSLWFSLHKAFVPERYKTVNKPTWDRQDLFFLYKTPKDWLVNNLSIQLSQNYFLRLTDKKLLVLKSHALYACNLILTKPDSNHARLPPDVCPIFLSVILKPVSLS